MWPHAQLRLIPLRFGNDLGLPPVQLFKSLTDDAVALAGHFFQPNAVYHFDHPSAGTDSVQALQLSQNRIYGGPARTEQGCQKILRDSEPCVCGSIKYHQHPSRTALGMRVQPVASSRPHAADE